MTMNTTVNTTTTTTPTGTATATANTSAAPSAIKPTPLTDSLESNVQAELAKLGEHLGQFKAYDSQLPIADIKGTRVVKCLYQKNPKTGEKARENAYTRVPTKHLTEEHIVARITELSPYVLSWLQEMEDKGIKEGHKEGTTQVFTEYLSLDKIIEALEAANENNRLNKDKIEAWFSDCLEEGLTELFAAKLGIDENTSDKELEKLAVIIGAYKAKFATLASPKVFFKEEDCTAMIKVISSVEAAKESILGKRFIAKLEELSKKEEDLLLTL